MTKVNKYICYMPYMQDEIFKNMPYRHNLPFLISDIRALECQKLKMLGYACMALNIRSVTT